MKFDAARAESLFDELGDPRYAGPEGEANLAGLVAARLAEQRLCVDRRELSGSWSQASESRRIGWLGQIVLTTAAYGLAVPDRVLTSIASLAAIQLGWYWLGAGLEGRFRPRRRNSPPQKAHLVLASTPNDNPAPAKVIFQAAPGGLRPDVFFPMRWPFGLFIALGCGALVLAQGSLLFRVASFLAVRIGGTLLPGRVHRWIEAVNPAIVHDVLPGLLMLAWVGIGGLILWETDTARRERVTSRPDRRGVAVLLELARTWPRPGSRPVEPVFLVAGGHGLEDPGSREEVVRLLFPKEGRSPTLLITFVGPGAGERIGLFTMDARYAGLHDEVWRAARDLWMPVRAARLLPTAPVLPFGAEHPAAVFIGSDPRAAVADSLDPQALHRAAQLAAEIALRWGKRQAAASPGTGG